MSLVWIGLATGALLLVGIFIGCFLVAVAQTASMARQLRNRSADSDELEAEHYKATVAEWHRKHIDLTPAPLWQDNRRARRRRQAHVRHRAELN